MFSWLYHFIGDHISIPSLIVAPFQIQHQTHDFMDRAPFAARIWNVVDTHHHIGARPPCCKDAVSTKEGQVSRAPQIQIYSWLCYDSKLPHHHKASSYNLWHVDYFLLILDFQSGAITIQVPFNIFDNPRATSISFDSIKLWLKLFLFSPNWVLVQLPPLLAWQTPFRSSRRFKRNHPLFIAIISCKHHPTIDPPKS